MTVLLFLFMLVADFYVFLRFNDMADSDLLDEGVSTGVSVTVVIFWRR